jgi:hypothetical protein
MCNHVVLIQCSATKLDRPAKARDMYVSTLFKHSLTYAESLNPDKIYVLSGKYGLLHLDDYIEPYNVFIGDMDTISQHNWAKGVVESLKKECDVDNDDFTLLCGIKYRRFLMRYLKNTRVPMTGLGIGEQLRFLKERI